MFYIHCVFDTAQESYLSEASGTMTIQITREHNSFDIRSFSPKPVTLWHFHYCGKIVMMNNVGEGKE